MTALLQRATAPPGSARCPQPTATPRSQHGPRLGPCGIPRRRSCATPPTPELAHALRLHQLPALEEVFRRYGAVAARTVRRLAGDHSVDDVVQEVFLVLWRAPERFDPERSSLGHPT